jgi:RHS repeat-associated protein
MLKLERNNLRTTATETMTWDKESRMLTNSLANASYAYNGFDARVSKTVGGNTTTFKRAGADPISPVLSDVLGGTTTRYLPGISSNVGGTSTFNHSGIKNGILQTNSSQTNTATKRYDAFGNELAATGTWQTRFDYGGAFGYQKDTESDYKLLGHRYYDPETGRFLTRDPIKAGTNWYVYCDSDTLTSADADGLTKIRLFWYKVWGPGYHTGIAIIDNAKGGTKPIYSFAGGPEYYDVTGFGKLKSRSGPWYPGTQDYNQTNGKIKGGIVLVDDDSPARRWISVFKNIEEVLPRIKEPDYSLIPDRWAGTANSNSWSWKLLKTSYLLDSFDHAIDKRGGKPWTPGWGHDPWSAR